MTHTVQSFWSKVHVLDTDDCWEWQGYQNKGRRSGKCLYGRIDIFGEKGIYAHRAAYFISDKTPSICLRRGDGLFVLHRCDNPLCCNPRHLFLGTHDQNMEDMVRKGRAPAYTSANSPRAKLTSEDVFWIRLHHKCGVTVNALALLHDVSRTTIKSTLSKRHYADVI